MRTPLPARLIGGVRASGRRTALLALPLAVALGAALNPAVAVGKYGPQAPQPSGGNATATSPAATRTHQITLLTGDVVILTTVNGRQTASVEGPAGTGQPAIYQQNGQMHVIPAEAVPYLESGTLDPNLFNVTLLARQGHDDQASKDLPLLLQAPRGAEAKRLPTAPAGSRVVSTLESIGAVSVDASKAQMRAFWLSLRGPDRAAVTADDARLTGAGRVWLNTTLRATLDDSVPQIGAPTAWRAGYDGDGVEVAVLDSGYDPTHPDLADQVVGARNFTAEEDPAGVTALDRNGHGTHVAATIAGSGAASGGDRKGAAPGADLLIGKVLDAGGSGSFDEIIAGMEWAAGSGAEVVNMSLGSGFASDGTDPLSQAVNELTRSTGTLFVVAAGNSGPDEGTVQAPGAADLALTVGAVTKDDRAAPFSSRGPRVVDNAIKPEIVAPGAGIIAARAAGTSLGNLVDEHYTSLNGTSMAAPHVAGAAAILAEQHPDWDADELKARLVATSAPLDDEPVSFQGAGRVDVARAVSNAVTVDDAVLSLGSIAHDAAPVIETLTYQNPTSAPVRLRLSAQVFGTGVDAEQPAIAFSKEMVTVPAGGEASVDVRLAPASTATGGYAGRIVADQLGGRTSLTTVVSFTIDGPLRTVTVNAVDRDGAPADGPVDFWNADTGVWKRIFLRGGAAHGQLPDGHYTMTAAIESPPVGIFPDEVTFAGDPNLVIDGDTTLHLDATDGRPIKISTPREADMESYDVLWQRTVGGRSFWNRMYGGVAGQQVYVIPSDRARTGEFEFVTQWQLMQPMLTVETSAAERVTPNPTYASLGDPYVGDATLPVVYAGTGTAESYASVDAAGKVALVTRSGSLSAQVQAAKAEGVALLLVHSTDNEPWTSTVSRQGLPTYKLTLDTGLRLRTAVEADPGLELTVSGLRDSTYLYELALSATGQLPADTSYEIGQDDLATITSDYRENSGRMSRREGFIPTTDRLGVGQLAGLTRNGPLVRTEYVTAGDGVRWQLFAQPHGQFPSFYFTQSTPEEFHPGERVSQTWWGPLVHPGVVAGYGAEELGSPVARFRDAIRIMLPHYTYGGTLSGTIYNQFGDTSELTLSSKGEVIGKSGWPQAQFTVPPEAGVYDLRLESTNGQGNPFDTASHTDTTWTFRSERPREERVVLPLVQLEYDLETNAYNQVGLGESYPLTIHTGYQPGARGPGRFRIDVEVSYDDGQTWLGALASTSTGEAVATIPAATDAGYASVRVVATDAAGNRIDQRIDRAWKVSD